MPPVVTVILTIYNAAKHLPTAVSSVLGQTYQDWQLVALDDNSSDPKVAEILDSITDPRVRVVHLPTTETDRRRSVRYAALINQAVEQVDSPYVTFLCGDDYYLPTRLERMVAKLRAGHDVVYGAQLIREEDGSPRLVEVSCPAGVRECQGVLSDAFYRVDLNSVMLTRTAFKKAGGFPTHTAVWRDADAYFWRRLTDAGYRFYPVDNPAQPTDAKRYRAQSVDMRVRRGETPW